MKKSVSSRAQVTVFIIIAIVLVVVGAGVFYLSKVSAGDKAYFNQPSIKPQVNSIQNSIVDCISETSKDSLELIGVQGGYYNFPKEYFDLGWSIIPYYYKEGSFLMPDNRFVERELGVYVDDNLGFCLDTLVFEGFELDYKEPRTIVSIKEKEVSFKVDMPVTIKREDKRITFETEEFPLSEKSSLKEMLEIARYVTDSHKEDPEMVCISCVADMARERELYVDMLDFADETTTLVVISNNQTSLPYIYEFLNKYPVTSEVPEAA